MKFIKYFLGLVKKTFRKEIFLRLIRLIKYKVIGLRYIKTSFRKRNEIYLIYTMGKVASSSIYETLKSILAYNNIFHVHFLTDKNMKLRAEFKKNPAVSIVEKYVQKKLQKNSKKKKKIITVVRDITSRDLSMIFQNLSSFNPTKNKLEYTIKEIEELYENLNNDLSLGWFDNEFLQFLDVDIYKYEFNKTQGYSIYEFDNMDILVIKLEKLNTIYSQALEEFTGIKFNRLININETSNKILSDFYKNVKRNIKISKNKLEHNYSSKFMKHFYSDEELIHFKDKWENNKRN